MKTILAVLLLSLIACSSPREQQKEVKDPLQIVYATDEEGKTLVLDQYNMLMFTKMAFPNAQIIMFEENYALIDFYWTMYNFVPYYNELVKQLDITYSPQFDCEDYSSMFKLEMQSVYRKQPKFHQGLAVATIIYYTGVKNQSHAVNVVFGIINGKFACIIVEPQDGSLINNTQLNMNNVWLVLL